MCIGSDISCCNTEHIQVLLSLALPPSQTRDKKSTKISPQIFVQDIIFWVITCSVFFYDLFMPLVFFGPLFIHYSCPGSQTRKYGLISECIVFTDFVSILFWKMLWPTVRKTCAIDQEKLLKVWGWKPRICKHCEITRTMYLNNEMPEQFLKQNLYYYRNTF